MRSHRILTLHIHTSLVQVPGAGYPLARIKSTNYLRNVMALMEAEQQGCDVVGKGGRLPFASTLSAYIYPYKYLIRSMAIIGEI